MNVIFLEWQYLMVSLNFWVLLSKFCISPVVHVSLRPNNLRQNLVCLTYLVSSFIISLISVQVSPIIASLGNWEIERWPSVIHTASKWTAWHRHRNVCFFYRRKIQILIQEIYLCICTSKYDIIDIKMRQNCNYQYCNIAKLITMRLLNSKWI